MMNLGERVAPAAAAVGAFSTLLCCLPLSFAGALGAAGLSAVAMEYRSWLIGTSVALLAFGFVQVYRRPVATCARRSRMSVVVLWLSAILVTVVYGPDPSKTTAEEIAKLLTRRSGMKAEVAKPAGK